MFGRYLLPPIIIFVPKNNSLIDSIINILIFHDPGETSRKGASECSKIPKSYYNLNAKDKKNTMQFVLINIPKLRLIPRKIAS
jgi:hypothetical protein